MFQSSIAQQDDTRLVELVGRLDSNSSGDFEKSLPNLFDGPGIKVVFDMTQLNYISSAGLRVVLMSAKRAKAAQGRLLLCGLQPHVKEVFEISGFLKLLEIADGRLSAIHQLSAN